MLYPRDTSLEQMILGQPALLRPPRLLHRRDEPYEKLKRAMRAEIDEGAWSTLYSTVSRPFTVPETGKIAVKVINDYGNEVHKMFET